MEFRWTYMHHFVGENVVLRPKMAFWVVIKYYLGMLFWSDPDNQFFLQKGRYSLF